MSATTKPKQKWKRRSWLAGSAGVLGLGSSAFAQTGKEKIRIGQIGTGHPHASGKMGAIRKFPEIFEVVGIVEPDDALWEKNANRYEGILRLTEEQLFNTKGLKAVAVETDIPDLVPATTRCVEQGLHVHLDKPAGIDLKSFRKAHDIAAKNQVAIQMGYMLRYNPAFQLLFKALEEGWLGEVFEVDGVMSKLTGDSGRAAMKPYAGGVMFELACHLVDAVVAVLGRPDEVHAHLRQTFPEKDGIVDHALAVFEYPKAVATVRTSLIEVEGHRRRQFVVCGTKGTVEIRPLEPPSMTLTLLESAGGFKKGANKVELPKMTGRYDEEFLDLARIIRGEKAPPFSPEHDLLVQECVLRASGMFPGSD